MSFLITDLPVIIFPQEVFRYLGYKAEKSKLSGNIERKIFQMIDEYRPIIKCKGVLRTFSVHNDKKILNIDNTDYTISISDLTEKFAEAVKITIMAVTLGQKIDDIISDLFAKDEYTQAVVLDAIGTEAVEQGANHFNEMLLQQAYQQGFQLTQRFSPGYGRWDIKNQEFLLELLEESKLDISLTEGYMLKPQKTITAVIGWIPFNEEELFPFLKKMSKCENCEFDCELR